MKLLYTFFWTLVVMGQLSMVYTSLKIAVTTWQTGEIPERKATPIPPLLGLFVGTFMAAVFVMGALATLGFLVGQR